MKTKPVQSEVIGQVSIQSAFGKDIAVYAGDLLFTVFFDLIADALYASPYLKVNAQMDH